MIILACNSYSAETSNPSASENPKSENPKSLDELTNVAFITKNSSPRTLIVAEKDDVSYVFWTNVTEADLRAHSATLPDDIGMTHTLVGRRLVPLGSPEGFECLRRLQRSDSETIKTIAKHLALTFRSLVKDMNNANAEGGPQKYFIPELSDIFFVTENGKYVVTLVPRSIAMTTTVAHKSHLATCAPELNEGGPCTEASLVYAYGVLLASILSGAPIIKDDPLEQRQYTYSGDRIRYLQTKVHNANITGRAKVLIKCCTNIPKFRPTFDGILNEIKEMGIQDFRWESQSQAQRWVQNQAQRRGQNQAHILRQSLAQSHDSFMDRFKESPQETWQSAIESILKRNNISPRQAIEYLESLDQIVKSPMKP
jgi:hypothetical protein